MGVSGFQSWWWQWLWRHCYWGELVLALALFWGMHGSVWLKVADSAALEKAYAQSQYVMGEGAIQKIDDTTLYIYAGIAYWRGEDPTTINFEHPPLAKYWYGLSWLLTGRPFALNILLYIGVWWLLWQLGRRLGYGTMAQAMVGLVLGSLTLLQAHVAEGLLDLPLLVANLAVVYALVRLPPTRHTYTSAIGVGLAVAAALTIKYPFPMQLLLLIFPLGWWWGKAFWRLWVVAGLAALAGYGLVYSMFFYHQHSIIDWLRFEWYRVHWWFGDRTMPKFLIFQTLFIGQFKGWWAADVYERAHWWQPTWPMVFLTQVLQVLVLWQQLGQQVVSLWLKGQWSTVSTTLQRHLDWLVAVLLVLYSVALLGLYALGAAAYERYLVILLPFWVLSLGGCVQVIWSEQIPQQNPRKTQQKPLKKSVIR